MENRLVQKIPLNPPLPKGEDARKDSLRVVDRQAGMTKETKINFIDTPQIAGCPTIVILNLFQDLLFPDSMRFRNKFGMTS